MLNVTNGMRNIAKRMLKDKVKSEEHGVYTYYADPNYSYVAVQYLDRDFALIDNYEF